VTASLSNRSAARVAYSSGSGVGRPSTVEATCVSTDDDVRWLDDQLFSGRRVQWVVVLAPGFGDQPYPLAPDDVARVLAGRAVVVAISRPQLNQLLTRELGRDLAVPVGGCRFFRTGLVLHDESALHPVLSPGAAALASVEAFREFAAEAMSPTHDPVEQVRGLRADLAAVRRQLRQRGPAGSAAAVESPAFPKLFHDPVEQFMHDLYAMWLQLTASDEADRERYPLAYDLGPQFVQSVNEMVRDGLVTRERVLRVCALVASGQSGKIKDVHQLRMARQGGTPTYAREDGALAYRCPVQNNTPAAARLHYWVQEGGIPELSMLVRHDDIKIV
jgi:hypothetical protein